MLFLLTKRQSRLYDIIEITMDIAFALLGVAILVTIATTIINNEVKGSLDAKMCLAKKIFAEKLWTNDNNKAKTFDF